MVERGRRSQTPGLQQQQVRRQGRPIGGIGVEFDALESSAPDQDDGEQQGGDVQRIDARQPLDDELLIVEALLTEGFEVDVGQDEARQHKEHVDAKIAFVEQGEMDRNVQFLDVGIEHDPERCEKSQAGERFKLVFGH